MWFAVMSLKLIPVPKNWMRDSKKWYPYICNRIRCKKLKKRLSNEGTNKIYSCVEIDFIKGYCLSIVPGLREKKKFFRGNSIIIGCILCTDEEYHETYLGNIALSREINDYIERSRLSNEDLQTQEDEGYKVQIKRF